jgi:transcriptional regulator with XRE-family HTH domain
MTASIHSGEYKYVLSKLIEMRNEAGMTQRDLAKKVKREVSFVWRIETGKRRLDMVEFYWVCNALGKNAADVYGEIIKEITAMKLPALSTKKISRRK